MPFTQQHLVLSKTNPGAGRSALPTLIILYSFLAEMLNEKRKMLGKTPDVLRYSLIDIAQHIRVEYNVLLTLKSKILSVDLTVVWKKG